RQPFEPEAGAADEGYRRVVLRLDVRLDPVQPQRPEEVSQQELEPLAHVAVARMAGMRVVAAVAAAEAAEDDLAQVVDADDRAVLEPADEKRRIARLAYAREPSGERLGRVGRRDPRPVQLPARTRQLDQLVAVTAGGRPEEDMLPDLDRRGKSTHLVHSTPVMLESQRNTREEPMLSFGVTVLPDPPYTRFLELIELAEANGFEYGWTYDSHILWQESTPLLTLAAERTKKMKFGHFVTNPGTREPTVLAS